MPGASCVTALPRRTPRDSYHMQNKWMYTSTSHNQRCHPKPLARSLTSNVPELPRLITKACAAVGQRWNATENTAKARERVFEGLAPKSSAKQKTGSLPFRLAGAARPATDRRPSPIHIHYARAAGFAQIPHYSKTTAIGTTTPITEFGPIAAARRDGWVLADLGTVSRWQTPYRNPGLYPGHAILESALSPAIVTAWDSCR